jgi:hypothetical protein
MVCAQSKGGVCEVFAKVVEYAKVCHSDWLNNKLMRIGANSIKDDLCSAIEKLRYRNEIDALADI